MRKRRLGKTGIEVSELCLGTWGLCGDGYGTVEEAQQDAVIERAVALGITAFDTADCYGKGAMERKLGKALPVQDGHVIITKVGTDRDGTPRKKCFTPQFLKESVEKSRERLGREKLDVVLLHNPSLRALEKSETCATLVELCQSGVVRAWGASVGSAATARAAIAAGAQVLELVYNAFSAQDLHEITAEIRASDTAVLARSVLAHGLLCAGWSRFKTFPAGDHRRERWTADQLRKRIDQAPALRALMGDDIPSTRAGALRFALNNDQVSAAVIGPRSAVQLDQLVREAGEGPPYVPADRLQRLSVRLVELGLPSLEPADVTSSTTELSKPESAASAPGAAP